MKAKVLILIIVIISLIGAMAMPAAAQDDVVVEIYFPVAVDSDITSILEGYAEAYEAENDGVDIIFSYEGGYGDVKTKLLTTIEGGGELPALAIMLATDIYDLRNAEAIQSWPVDEAYLEDFSDTWLTNSYYDYDGDGEGELYGLPFQRSTVLMYYNMDLLAEAGLEAPTNWEELATTAQALTTEDRWGILIPNSWPYWLFQPFAAGAGQNIVSESDVEVYFSNEEVVEALQFWVDLYDVYGATPEGVQNNWGDAPGAFLDGTAAFIIHSSGSLGNILRNAEFEVGVSGIPGQDGDAYTVTGGGNIYLVSGIDDATTAAATDFVQWLTEAERAVDWSIQSGYYNTRESGFETDAWTAYVEENPAIADAAATVDNAVREFSVQSLGDVRNILHENILAVLNGEADAGAALQQAQTDADGLLSIFQ